VGPALLHLLTAGESPLEKAVDVPEFVKAKAAEIATHLPGATFTVEELRSERRVYDPFLHVLWR